MLRRGRSGRPNSSRISCSTSRWSVWVSVWWMIVWSWPLSPYTPDNRASAPLIKQQNTIAQDATYNTTLPRSPIIVGLYLYMALSGRSLFNGWISLSLSLTPTGFVLCVFWFGLPPENSFNQTDDHVSFIATLCNGMIGIQWCSNKDKYRSISQDIQGNTRLYKLDNGFSSTTILFLMSNVTVKW